MIAIVVKVAPGAGGGVNEVSVSGGGAPSALSRRSLALDRPSAQFGLENYELNPEEEGGALDTQAGSHPFQLTTTLMLDTQTALVSKHRGERSLEAQPPAFAKDLSFSLPAGLIGNPTPLSKCSVYVFTQAVVGRGPGCPDDTVVGVATPIVTNPSVAKNVPYAFSVPLYNLEPSVGEPAKFGFGTAVSTPVILDTSVRTGGDYGVVVTVPNITELVGFIGSQVTFWGSPSDPRHDTARGPNCLTQFNLEGEQPEWERPCPVDGKPAPFLIMPTSCAGSCEHGRRRRPMGSRRQLQRPEGIHLHR